MTLKISTASEADIESMALITYAAFHTNDPANMSSRFFPHNTAKEIQEWQVRQLAASFQDQYTNYMKVTDTTNGRVVSYARWGWPHPATPEANGLIDKPEHMQEPALPKGANARLLNAFDAAMDRKRALYMDQGRDYSKRQ